MRLHVGVGRAEQLLGPIDRQGFRDIDKFATAVVALARIAFGVLVGEHRSLSLQHPRTGIILRGDELDMILLPAAFAGNRLREFRIEAGNRHLGAKHAWISRDSR